MNATQHKMHAEAAVTHARQHEARAQTYAVAGQDGQAIYELHQACRAWEQAVNYLRFAEARREGGAE